MEGEGGRDSERDRDRKRETETGRARRRETQKVHIIYFHTDSIMVCVLVFLFAHQIFQNYLVAKLLSRQSYHPSLPLLQETKITVFITITVHLRMVELFLNLWTALKFGNYGNSIQAAPLPYNSKEQTQPNTAKGIKQHFSSKITYCSFLFLFAFISKTPNYLQVILNKTVDLFINHLSIV